METVYGGRPRGNYEQCCWQTEGIGQFRPGAGSRPFLGETGALETVREAKVELVCVGECIEATVAALVATHPYETPAYQYWPVLTRFGH